MMTACVQKFLLILNAEPVEHLDVMRWTSTRGAGRTVFALAGVCQCAKDRHDMEWSLPEQSLVWLPTESMELRLEEEAHHTALWSLVLCLL